MDKQKIFNYKDVTSYLPETQNSDSSLPPLLLEYETFIASLQEEMKLYKTEHQSLQKDLTGLVSENRNLSDRLKEVLSNKLSNEAILLPSHKKESDMVTNLQQQLSLTVQEKDSAVEMWHLAIREVENLEEELKLYQDNRHGDVAQNKLDSMKKNFTNALTMMESKLTSARSMLTNEKHEKERLEKELEKCLQENSTLTDTLNLREQELQESLEGQCITARKLQEIEEKSTDLQKQVATLKEAENEMELALTRCHERIDVLHKKNLEAQEKVGESLHLVECAIVEKDAALFKESQIREENFQLQKVMAGIVDEAGARVKEEIDNMRQHYNKKLKVLLRDFKKLEDEKNEKDKHLKKEIQEKVTLEEQLEKMQKDTPVVTSTMEKKMTMAYNELSDLKRDNMMLTVQKENFKAELEKMQESHSLEIRKMNIERHLLEEQVLGLQTQLQITVRAKAEESERVIKLITDIKMLEHEIERRNIMSKKDLSEWQQQQHYQDGRQELMSEIKQIKEQSNATASELELHLENQHILKTKYQKTMKIMTEKFEKRIQELHSEASNLRKENKDLEDKLQSLHNKLSEQIQSKKET